MSILGGDLLDEIKKYQELKIRYDKATNYFEDDSIPHQEKEKFLENFIELLNEIRIYYKYYIQHQIL